MKKVILCLVGLLLVGCGIYNHQDTNNIKTVSGTLVIGHEVRAFTDNQDGKEYWVIDKSGKLIAEYKKTIGTDIVNYEPVKAKLKVQQKSKMTDGFGADYTGTYEVKEIISLDGK